MPGNQEEEYCHVTSLLNKIIDNELDVFEELERDQSLLKFMSALVCL